MFRKNATMAELVKTVQEKEELESQLKSAKSRISELEKDLTATKGKIGELETKLNDTNLKELKDKAKRSAAEFEGLKELYTEKVRAFDESLETREEEFARESAVKRNDLKEELQANRDENQERVRNTVKDFAGSYLYYMDQIRLMMDALNQAAAETGSTLFEGDVKERFGASIAEHLRKDVNALEQSTRDRLLIGAADKPEAPEETYEEYPEEADRLAPEEFSVEEADEFDMPKEFAEPETESEENDEENDPDDD